MLYVLDLPKIKPVNTYCYDVSIQPHHLAGFNQEDNQCQCRGMKENVHLYSDTVNNDKHGARTTGT